MINGHRACKGRLQMFRMTDDLTDIGGTSHIDGHENLIQQKTDAHNDKGNEFRKKKLGKTIPHTNKNKQYRFPDQDCFFAESVYGITQERLKADTDTASRTAIICVGW
jgi:hypothetical protein